MSVVLRVLLGLAGAALLVDGAVLMVLGHFDLGTMLPAALGAVFLALAAWWAPLARWRHRGRRRQQLWRAGW